MTRRKTWHIGSLGHEQARRSCGRSGRLRTVADARKRLHGAFRPGTTGSGGVGDGAIPERRKRTVLKNKAKPYHVDELQPFFIGNNHQLSSLRCSGIIALRSSSEVCASRFTFNASSANCIAFEDIDRKSFFNSSFSAASSMLRRERISSTSINPDLMSANSESYLFLIL